MRQRRLGDRQVSAIGLGAMQLSAPPVQRDDAIRVVHAALDAGVTLIDTADAYAPTSAQFGHNEVVAEALRRWGGDRDAVVVATKGGHTRTAGDGWGLDGKPAYLRRACDASLRRLGVEAIGLYQHHRPDPSVPYAETLGALRDLRDDGKVRLVGISNADPSQIATAVDVLGAGGLAAVQNELSPRFRSSEPEVDLCESLGVAFLPWSPLGGAGQAHDVGSRYAAFAAVADARGVSAQRVVLAWLLSRSPVVVPIPGASRVASVRDSVAAADLDLTQEEMRQLAAAG